jgi:2',3'-cyclic-nucleotide 2'-phosphodiesterase (5'-nucleotidase family)
MIRRVGPDPAKIRLRVSRLLLLVIVLLSGCARCWQAGDWTHHQYALDSLSAPDPLMEALLLPYREALVKEMSELISHAARDLPKNQPESPLGNLLADLALEALGDRTDAVILNYGGIRLPQLAAGPVTKGHFYELLPFENYLAIVELDLAGMNSLAEAMAQAGGWPISAGLGFRIGPDGVEGLTLHGEALQAERRYRIGMPDYVANGGDNCAFLIAYPREVTALLLRDACIGQARVRYEEGRLLDAEVEGRITLKPKP